MSGNKPKSDNNFLFDLYISNGQFELNENDKVCYRGGDHAGQSAPGDLKQPAPRDWLRVVDDVHDLLYLCTVLQGQLGVLKSKESDVLETSIKTINFKAATLPGTEPRST